MPFQAPQSPRTLTEGLVYFARLCDKVRLHQQGSLHPDYIENLGKGMDGWTCEFLEVSYDLLQQKILEGLSDIEVLHWCYAQGAKPPAHLIRYWNSYMSHRGFRDDLSEKLSMRKAHNGWQKREDILTFFDYLEADDELLAKTQSAH